MFSVGEKFGRFILSLKKMSPTSMAINIADELFFDFLFFFLNLLIFFTAFFELFRSYSSWCTPC